MPLSVIKPLSVLTHCTSLSVYLLLGFWMGRVVPMSLVIFFFLNRNRALSPLGYQKLPCCMSLAVLSPMAPVKLMKYITLSHVSKIPMSHFKFKKGPCCHVEFKKWLCRAVNFRVHPHTTVQGPRGCFPLSKGAVTLTDFTTNYSLYSTRSFLCQHCGDNEAQ